jgi:hypothetical protein
VCTIGREIRESRRWTAEADGGEELAAKSWRRRAGGEELVGRGELMDGGELVRINLSSPFC